VLICDETDGEYFGYLLNSSVLNVQIDSLFDSIEDYEIYYGGPVQRNTLHFIHRCPDLIEGCFEIFKGVYHGGNFEQAIELLKFGKINKNDIRFFLGYAGWAKGQLEEELGKGSWIVSNIKEEDVFQEKGKTLWKKLVKQKGGDYKLVANYPMDPRLN
jgi:putative transcriptional regulator